MTATPAGPVTATAPRAGRWRVVGVLLLYLVIAAIYTRPLLEQSMTHIANDPYDPILNTAILWWNATTVPFSHAWWNPPYFYPGDGISAFTENLVGVSVIASPVYWITRNPLAAYNISFFLTWPLSAFTVFLLTRYLTRRDDAAFLAGIAFGFSPYRTSEMGHIQMLSSYWLPLSLLGLHAYVQERRVRWLVLLGAAWLLQALANGYFLFFGAVVIGLWMLYFGTTRAAWRTWPAIAGALIVASLPLVPVLWNYYVIHEKYALRRLMSETIYYSAPTHAWFEVSPSVWLWSHVLPWAKDNLFPGVTAILLVAATLVWLLARRDPVPASETRTRRRLRIGGGVLALVSLAALTAMLITGPWSVTWVGVVIRMTDPSRALFLLALGGLPFLWWTRRTREALQNRSPFVFYAAATVVMVLLCYGPVMRVGEEVILDPGPYGWLMHVPGFDQLRVPTRFWMAGTMCLAVAAGLAFARVGPVRRGPRSAAFALVFTGLMLDGWIRPVNMAEAPQLWPRVERRDQARPIVELPLGPEWDAAATYRSIWTRRPVANGVSGYDPPHYAPLMDALDARDPAILVAMGSLGTFDVVVNGAQDPKGALAAYVLSVPGVQVIATDGIRTAYQVPAMPSPEMTVGPALPIRGVWANGEKDATVMVDGDLDTEWNDGPQNPRQWVVIDLGEAREVGSVTESLGEFARDFSRRQAVDVSLDGERWEEAWQGTTAAQAFLAAVRGPREAAVRIAFPPRQARFVRLRQIATHRNLWRVAELRINGPRN